MNNSQQFTDTVTKTTINQTNSTQEASILKEEADNLTKTYAMGIEFIGTNYRGWQRQQEVLGVQQVLEEAIGKIANETIEVVCAGRTDAGVHASNMIAHFITKADRPIYNWLRGINTLLPNDIAIRWLVPMPASFHARFNAKARRYRYITLNQPQRPAILNKQVTHVFQPLDIDAMQIAAADIVGTHDFTSFRAAACQSNQPIRNIHHAKLFKHGQFIVFDIQADGFLHHMVRNLMGTLYAVGRKELPTTAIKDLLALKDRTQAPPTAAADGLYFINCLYPEQYQSLLPNLPMTPVWLNLP